MRTRNRSRSGRVPGHVETSAEFDDELMYHPERLPFFRRNPWLASDASSFSPFPIIVKVNYFALHRLWTLAGIFPHIDAQFNRWHPDIIRQFMHCELASCFVCTFALDTESIFLPTEDGYMRIAKVMELVEQHCRLCWNINLPRDSYELISDMPSHRSCICPTKIVRDFISELDCLWRQNHPFHLSFRAEPNHAYMNVEQACENTQIDT